MGVRPALEYAERHAADRRDGGTPGDEPGRHRGHRGRRRARGPSRDGTPPTSSWSSAARRTRAKLLLRSATDKHPNGLANGSDQVGRNYMFHDSQAVLALSKEPNPTVFQKTLGVNDFYFEGPDFPYPMGNIQMIGKSQAEMYRGEKPIATKLAPEFALEDVAEHAVDFWLSTEDLPMPDNRVTLDSDANVRLAYKREQPDRGQAPLPPAQVDARAPAACTRITWCHRFAYMKTDIPIAGVRAPGRHLPDGQRPDHVGGERRLPGARGGQSVRRGHERVPEHRRGESGADRDGQRDPGRRPPARAASAPRRRRAARGRPRPAGEGGAVSTQGCCSRANRSNAPRTQPWSRYRSRRLLRIRRARRLTVRRAGQVPIGHRAVEIVVSKVIAARSRRRMV